MALAALDGSFAEGRLPPFSWVSRAASRRLADHFSGGGLAQARSIYLAVAELASEAYAGAERRLPASVLAVAERAGVDSATVKRYSPRLAEAGLLRRECEGRGKRSTWVLIEPKVVQGAPGSTEEKVVHRAPGEETTWRTVHQEGGAPCTRSRVTREVEEKDPPLAPPTGGEPTQGTLSEDTVAWQRVLDHGGLRDALGAMTFDSWIAPLEPEAVEPGDDGGGVLTLRAAPGAAGWVRTRYAAALDRAAAAALGEGWSIEVTGEPKPPVGRRRRPRPEPEVPDA